MRDSIWAYGVPGVAFAFVSALSAVSCSGDGENTPLPIAAADVVLVADATTDYGTVTLGDAKDISFKVLNQGAGDATLSGLDTAGLGLAAPYTQDGGDCAEGTVLHGGKNESCKISVKFAPSVEGTYSTNLVVHFQDATQPDLQTPASQWQLVGTGMAHVEPAAHVTISSVGPSDLGQVAIGDEAEVTLTVLNDGAGTANLALISTEALGLSAPLSLVGGTCSTGTILAGSSSQACTLVVRFVPQVATDVSQTLSIHYTDATSDSEQSAANTVSLTATGILDCTHFPQSACPQPAPLLKISSQPTFDFGEVTIGTTQDHTFTVTNSGAAPATLQTVTADALGIVAPFSLLGGTCATGRSLDAGGATCSLIVRYTPSTPNADALAISLAYTGSTGPLAVTLNLNGTGVLDCAAHQPASPSLCPPPASNVAISGSGTYDLGTVAIGNFVDRTFTLSNSGNANAVLGTVTDATVGVAAPLQRLGGTCASGTVLTAQGGSCTYSVRFTPTATVTSTGALTFSYTDSSLGTTGNVSRPYTAQGVVDCFNFPQAGCPAPAPQFAISGSADFGSVAVGNYQEHTLTVTNNGNKDGQMSGADSAALGLSAPFEWVGGSCVSGQNLARKGGSCTLVVRYTPASVGTTSSQALSIAYNGAAAPQTAKVTLTGKAILDCTNFRQPQCPALAPNFVFSASSGNFGNVSVETSAVLTLTLYNKGQGDGKLGTVSTTGLGLSSPFSLAGGSCVTGQTVPAKNGACTMIFKVSPTTPGNFSSVVKLKYTYPDGSTGSLTAAQTNLYAGGVLNCNIASLGPAYRQGVQDAQGINASQAAKGTADGQQAGYTAGYNAGYQATYTGVYTAAYNQSYQAAYTPAYNNAYGTGSSLGCSDGTNVGATDGKRVATTDGKHDGYVDGYADGHATGETDGYDDGFTAGQNACPTGSPGSSGTGSPGSTGTGSTGSSGTGSSGSSGSGSSGSSGAGSGGSSGSDGSFGARFEARSAMTVHLLAPSFNDANAQACYTQAYGATLDPNAYQNAFNAASAVTAPSYLSGYTDGKQKATTDATQKGNLDGAADGASKGKSDGASKGYTDGYASCYKSQYQTSYGQQYPISYNSGYTLGSTDGYNDGYESGYDDGKAAGLDSCPNASPARVLVRSRSGIAQDVLPRALSRPSFGKGLPGADGYAAPPVLQGIWLGTESRDSAKQRARILNRPALRFTARQKQLNAR